jgi:RHS repeat-associated protein
MGLWNQDPAASTNAAPPSTASPATVPGANAYDGVPVDRSSSTGRDASGNTLYDGNNEYWYDAEGQLCAVQSQRYSGGAVIQYVYDAEGARIAKGTLAQAPAIGATCAPPLGSGFTLTARYLVDLGGDQVTELSEQGPPTPTTETWAHSNLWAGGKLTATYDPRGIHFEITDPLGTKRVQANALGQVDEQCTSLPFGNDVNNPVAANCTAVANSLGTNDDATEHHFTGKERDTESGNDYFGKRYYASSMGRWMSPDRVTVTDERILNPANTLNLYAYGANNPLKYVDPDGQDITYFYDQAGTAGHAVLFAYNQANGDSAIESFGPVKHQPYAQGTADFDMDQFKSAQDLRMLYAAITIQTNPELTQEIINYIRTNPDPDKWAWDGPNCSTQCGKILQKFKLDYQKSLVNRNLTPKFLFNNLMMRYNPSQQNVTPSGGVDYGNSSSCGGGSCMFDLFWLSIQSGNNATVTATATNCVTGNDGKQHCDTQ